VWALLWAISLSFVFDFAAGKGEVKDQVPLSATDSGDYGGAAVAPWLLQFSVP
jgi:hypothetical protein